MVGDGNISMWIWAIWARLCNLLIEVGSTQDGAALQKQASQNGQDPHSTHHGGHHCTHDMV
jgi:hypothetical protein